MGGEICLPLPLGEGWGEGLSANLQPQLPAGFSPQSVQKFFAGIEELTSGSSQ